MVGSRGVRDSGGIKGLGVWGYVRFKLSMLLENVK